MKNSKKLIIIIAIAVLVIAGIAYYAYSEYNRKSTDVTKAKTDFNIAAIDLANQFNTNEKESILKYQTKVLEIAGTIKKIDTDENGFSTIVLGDTASSSSIRCSLDSLHLADTLGLITGKSIDIKGICTGFNADDMGLGSDVILNKCMVIKKNK